MQLSPELVRETEPDDTVDGFSGNEGANDNEEQRGPELRYGGEPIIKNPELNEGDDGSEGKKELEVTAENFNTEEVIEMARVELSKATGMLIEDLIPRPDLYIGIYEKRLNDVGTDFIDKDGNSEMDLVRKAFQESSPINVERMQLAIDNYAENIGKFVRSDTDGYSHTEDGTEKRIFSMSFVHKDRYISSIPFEFRPHEDEKDKEGEDDELSPAEGIQDDGSELLNVDERPEDESVNYSAKTPVVMAETVQAQDEETQTALEKLFSETVLPAQVPSPADSIGDRLLRAALFFEPQVTQQEAANDNILSPIQPQDLSFTEIPTISAIDSESRNEDSTANTTQISNSETQAEIVTDIGPEIVSDGISTEEEKASEAEVTASILNVIPTIKRNTQVFSELRPASEIIIDTKYGDGNEGDPDLSTEIDLAIVEESVSLPLAEAIQEITAAKVSVESGITIVKIDAEPAPIAREIPKVVTQKQNEIITIQQPDQTKGEIDQEVKDVITDEILPKANTVEVPATDNFSHETISDVVFENTIFVESENHARVIEATQKELDTAREEIHITSEGMQFDRVANDPQILGARAIANAANDNQQVASDRIHTGAAGKTFPTYSRSGITMRIAA